MSDPSSGVAHPVFFPAGRLDPVVTLTRCIDMYLIGSFPRPQFFRGPRLQLLAVPRPQFSIEVCYLPLEPRPGASRAPPGPDASSGTPRFPAVDPNDQSATTNTRIRTTSSSLASRCRTRQPASRRAPTRPRATTRPVPDPGRRTASTAARKHEPTRRVPMTHGAARPSRAPARGSGSVTRQEQRASARREPNAVRPSSEERATGRRTAPTRHSTKAADDQDRDEAGGDGEELRRPSDRHHIRRERLPTASLQRQERAPRKQRGTRTKNRDRTGQQTGHSSTPQTIVGRHCWRAGRKVVRGGCRLTAVGEDCVRRVSRSFRERLET